MIEIGRCYVDKWTDYNMLHVGFGLTVTYVERRIDVIASIFAGAVKDFFGKAKEER